MLIRNSKNINRSRKFYCFGPPWLFDSVMAQASTHTKSANQAPVHKEICHFFQLSMSLTVVKNRPSRNWAFSCSEKSKLLSNQEEFSKIARESATWDPSAQNPCPGFLKFITVCSKIAPEVGCLLIDGKFQTESFCLFSAICYNGFAFWSRLWEEF